MSRSVSILLTLVAALAAALSGAAQSAGPTVDAEKLAEKIRSGYTPVDQAEPPITNLERELLDRAYALLEENPQHAFSFLQDTLKTDLPISAAFHHALGNVYFQNGNYFMAESQYLAAIKKHPSFRRAWNTLGLSQYMQGEYKDAAASLSISITHGARDATTYGILGYCNLRLGRHRSAETAYNYAILFDPEETDWAEGMAQIYYETGRYENAISVFDDLIRVEPENAEFWLMKANAWLALDEPLKTARCIEIARRVGTVDTDSLHLLGNIYLDQGIYDRARDVFIASASDQGELDRTEAMRAIRYLTRNDQHEYAEEIFALIEEEDPAWPEQDKTLYRFLKGEFAFFRDDFDQAETAYQAGLELDPFNSYALLKLAHIKMEQGEADQAVVYFDRAATDPKSRYNALLSKAILLIDKERYTYALKTIEQALATKDDERLRRLHAQVKRVVETRPETASIE